MSEVTQLATATKPFDDALSAIIAKDVEIESAEFPLASSVSQESGSPEYRGKKTRLLELQAQVTTMKENFNEMVRDKNPAYTNATVIEFEEHLLPPIYKELEEM